MLAPRIELGVGAVVPAPYLAAIQFLTSGTGVGVGVSASRVMCVVDNGGDSTEPFPVWEVVSSDGGRVWRTTGTLLPRALATGFTDAELAFSSTSSGWLEAGGTLGYTDDKGLQWRIVDLGAIVTALEPDGHTDVALVSHELHPWAEVWLLSPRARFAAIRHASRSPGTLFAVRRRAGGDAEDR